MLSFLQTRLFLRHFTSHWKQFHTVITFSSKKNKHLGTVTIITNSLIRFCSPFPFFPYFFLYYLISWTDLSKTAARLYSSAKRRWKSQVAYFLSRQFIVTATLICTCLHCLQKESFTKWDVDHLLHIDIIDVDEFIQYRCILYQFSLLYSKDTFVGSLLNGIYSEQVKNLSRELTMMYVYQGSSYLLMTP